MTPQAVEGACAFAWRNYLLLHSGVSENDNRRSALYRYVTNLRDIGENDFDLLQIAAVAYLRKLDELHDDRGARLAADQALAECLESRSAQPDKVRGLARPLGQHQTSSMVARHVPRGAKSESRRRGLPSTGRWSTSAPNVRRA